MVWTAIISGVVGQLLCLYILIRFVVEYCRNIREISNLTWSHVEGILIWICGLIFFSTGTYFYKNLLRLNIDVNHCIVFDTIIKFNENLAENNPLSTVYISYQICWKHI